ncbi:ribose-5-phosphate isomerase RpiA [Salimicrobium album]|uniref:Ribose 5-phosphate isomerase A n=1 Tax=Salimicrobium album TaxID=50717 RepID=A0A1H3FTH9_9BACI|nr:ribose-5-phosphate isomerase RpiA [Salimicrobium album]SDX93678.1 ribose-5-phosphate isomerase [Salimicrobium album]
MNSLKRRAALEALNWIEDGMTVGLGSGSTAEIFLHGLRHKNIQGVASSKKTEVLARSLGIPLVETNDIDVAVDGTDAVDDSLTLIKGGGGSLVREKLVAYHADVYIVIGTKEKWKKTLHDETVPVEVLPFLHEGTEELLLSAGGHCTLRLDTKKNPFVSDNGNFIYDCTDIGEVIDFHEKVVRLPGVVNTGVFLNLADIVLIGEDTGVRTERRHKA